MTINVKIIGLGGIGTALCDPLCRFMNYLKTEHFKVTLVDGDSYEIRNQERQIFNQIGNKATVKFNDLRGEYDDVMFDEFTEYVNTENVGEVIQENDIVFIGVDNHMTRKIISDYAQSSVKNITIISGGNEFTDGNVQIYIRKEGKDITPSLTAYHPEIEIPGDKSPEDMSCQELAESAPQLLFTNLTVATIMCWVFYRLVKTEGVPGLIGDKSEVYFDIVSMSALSKSREVPNN